MVRDTTQISIKTKNKIKLIIQEADITHNNKF